MRRKDRIKPFLDELATLWGDEFQDWRFGQLMSNFVSWLWQEKNIDIFFIEENRFLELFREFAGK